MIYNVYLPSATKLWQGNVFRSVWGVCLSACWVTQPPRQTPTPFGKTDPPGQTPPGQTLPLADTTPPWQTPTPGQTPLGQTSPLDRHSPGQIPPLGRHPRVDTPLVRHPQADTPRIRQTPPWADTPLDRHPRPPSRRLLQRTVRILLECILVIMLSKAKIVYFV